MRPSKEHLTESGRTISIIAREIGVPLQDLSHFVRAEMDKVGREKRKKIQAWMVGQGYMRPTRKPEICICPLCQAKHVKGKNAAQRLEAMSFEVHGRP
jgi:hypothetical protein